MLSVLIPTHNSERQLVPVLSALVPGVTTGLVKDVVLVDGGSTDDTAVIADIAGCEFFSSIGDEGMRLRQAVARARGHWLLFLSSRSMLEEGWTREVGTFIEKAERRGAAERMAATFRLAVEGYGFAPRFDEAIAATRLTLLGLPRESQGLLLSRRYYDRLGGHPDGNRAQRRFLGRIGRRHLHTLRTHVLLPEGR